MSVDVLTSEADTTLTKREKQRPLLTHTPTAVQRSKKKKSYREGAEDVVIRVCEKTNLSKYHLRLGLDKGKEWRNKNE